MVEVVREEIHTRKSLKQVRKSLRDSLTPAEGVLWKQGSAEFAFFKLCGLYA